MKLVKLTLALVITSIITLGLGQSISHATTSDNARDSLPSCDNTQIAIYNGASFEGTVYLHETDVKLDRNAVRTIRALAAQGEVPAVCAVNGTAFVTLASK